MREVTGDLWTYPADVRVITTNGSIRKDGAAVMGRGVALQAKQRYPGIEHEVGGWIDRDGNYVQWHDDPRYCTDDGFGIITFPVKHRWNEKADVELIRRSAYELLYRINLWNRVVLAEDDEIRVVAMPRPGCGNGGLDWKDVKPILEPILDDRFVIVERNP